MMLQAVTRSPLTHLLVFNEIIYLNEGFVSSHRRWLQNKNVSVKQYLKRRSITVAFLHKRICSTLLTKGIDFFNFVSHQMHDFDLLCVLSTGFRHSIFHCVSRLNNVQVSEASCDSSSRPTPQEEPCNLQPCPAL